MESTVEDMEALHRDKHTNSGAVGGYVCECGMALLDELVGTFELFDPSAKHPYKFAPRCFVPCPHCGGWPYRFHFDQDDDLGERHDVIDALLIGDVVGEAGFDGSMFLDAEVVADVVLEQVAEVVCEVGPPTSRCRRSRCQEG